MKKGKSKKTFTKKITFALLIIGVIEGTIPYILSFLNKDSVYDLGLAWVTSIVAVALGYFIRGYKDSKAMGEYEIKKMEVETNDDNENEYERNIYD